MVLFEAIKIKCSISSKPHPPMFSFNLMKNHQAIVRKEAVETLLWFQKIIFPYSAHLAVLFQKR